MKANERWGHVSYEQCQEALTAANGNKKLAAELLGMPESTYRDKLKRGPEDQDQHKVEKGEFTVYQPLPGHVDVDELVKLRIDRFKRKKEYEESRSLIDVRIKLKGPVGILHFGDPHVDDDGTDLEMLQRDMNLVRDTVGLFGGNVGDTTNNWVGRLAALYGEQGTTANEAWLLAEWFVSNVEWLYVVGGNHDAWSGSGDPLKWICRQQNALYESAEARLGLTFPNGRVVRVNVRHDFAGHSQWNPAHGSMKAAQLGFHDHININGHKHVNGYGVIKDPLYGTLSHCIQVGSYKIYDRYQREKGFRDQQFAPSCLTVIDPDATDETGLVQVFWDTELGADFLTYLRRKRGH